MTTAKQLKKKYESDLKKLQKSCKHKNKTDWLSEEYAPVHTTGWKVIQCKTCWKILQREGYCYNCEKDILIDEDDYIKLKADNPIKFHYCSKFCSEQFSHKNENYLS